MSKRRLTWLIDLFLYGHLWIAACALAMTVQTRWLLSGRFAWTALEGFIFFGTLALYTLHRLVALRLKQASTPSDRYALLSQFRRRMLGFFGLAALGAAYCFLQLPPILRWHLLPPGAVALAYVLPLLNGRRLRDFPYVKIFLIAGAWAWITVASPARELGLLRTAPALLMLLERVAFIFAITIPFDIRDLALDAEAHTKTLPGRFGSRRAKGIAWLSLLLMVAFVVLNTYIGAYGYAQAGALLLSALGSGWLIQRATPDLPDAYFTGWLDGTMVFQAILVFLASL